MPTFEQTQALDNEFRDSYHLIRRGFGSLQEIDCGNDFYHLPLQLLASGLERFLKCFICIQYESRNGMFPDDATMRLLGHDIEELTEEIRSKYFVIKNIPALAEDEKFLVTDLQLREVLKILSTFGRFARYYNLDVISGSTKNLIDPSAEWGNLERTLEDSTPYLLQGSGKTLNDYYERVSSKIVAIIERFIRAIMRQFTLGKTGGDLSRFSVRFYDFVVLMDDQLGKTDYRHFPKSARPTKDN